MPNFIKVQRILKNKETGAIKVEPETISINDIKGFRPWHKGKSDEKVEGDITAVIVKTEGHKDKAGNEVHQQMIHINENYADFEDRVGQRTTVKK